jgi:hypothetical protein
MCGNKGDVQVRRQEMLLRVLDAAEVAMWLLKPGHALNCHLPLLLRFLLAFCLATFRSVGQYEVAVSALNNFNAMFAPK